RICATRVGSPGIQLPMTIRPPGRVTRTISLATSNGFGANIAPKILTTRSKLWSFTSFRLDASPSWNLKLARFCSLARRFPASTRLLAISTPSTSAPSFASGSAVVPSPHPRSRTLSPLVMPRLLTSASPLSRMQAAMRVKSPFSHNALFGFMASLPVGPAGESGGNGRPVAFDRLRPALVVDRDVRKIAVGHQDRLDLLAPDHPGLEMHRDRGAAEAHELGVHGDEVADIDRLPEIDRVDRNRHVAGLGDLGGIHAAADVHLAQKPAAENIAVLVGVGRHGQRAGAEIADRLGFVDRRRMDLRVGHLNVSQPGSAAKRSPNFCASARKVAATFSGPRVRA